MTDIMRIITPRPVGTMTASDQAEFLRFVTRMANQGRMVVLGDKRCFLCGVELGERIEADLKEQRAGDPTVLMNVCSECYAEIEGAPR
jgi:hypothetical protein